METTILGLYRESGKENGNYYIWVIQGEWKREWTLLYLGYIGRMEKKIETNILVLYRENGRENGNYYSTLALLVEHSASVGEVGCRRFPCARLKSSDLFMQLSPEVSAP